MEFENLSCDSIILDEFDYLYGASNGSNSSDDLILISKKKRSNVIFPLCKRLVYKAVHLDNNGDTLSSTKVGITNINHEKDLKYQNQRILKFEYIFSKEIREKYINYLSEADLSFDWVCSSYEGFIENEDGFWMHPPRHNQFVSSELVPFPEIKFPLVNEKRWNKTLNIIDGWGKWSGLQVKCNYRMEFVEDDENWIVYGKGYISNGDSTSMRITFNTEYGITNFKLINHFDEELSFERILEVD